MQKKTRTGRYGAIKNQKKKSNAKTQSGKPMKRRQKKGEKTPRNAERGKGTRNLTGRVLQTNARHTGEEVEVGTHQWKPGRGSHCRDENRCGQALPATTRQEEMLDENTYRRRPRHMADA